MTRRLIHIRTGGIGRCAPTLLTAWAALLVGLAGCTGSDAPSASVSTPVSQPASASAEIMAMSPGEGGSSTSAAAPTDAKPATQRFWSRFVPDYKSRAPQGTAGDADQPMARLKITLGADGTFTESRAASPAGSPQPPLPEPELAPEMDDTIPVRARRQRAAIAETPATPPAGIPDNLEPETRDPDDAPMPAAEEETKPAKGPRTVPAAERLDEVDFRYRVRSGDTLNISIPYEADTSKSVPVQPDGYIRYLFDIEVMAAGLTHKQLAAVLNQMPDQYFVDPQVTLLGTSFAGNSVFVMGPVRRPGPPAIQNDTRLLDVLATAGALGMVTTTADSETGSVRADTREIIDLENAYIARGDTILDVDFRRLLIGRDMSMNILLKPKDFVFLPSIYGSEKKIYICGHVRNPMVYRYADQKALTFLEAILEAGGTLTPDGGGEAGRDSAMDRRCYIVRKGEREPLVVDYAAIREGREPDVAMQPGDILFVPERPLHRRSRIASSVISEVLAPLRSVLELDNTMKTYYRRDWQFPSRGKSNRD